MFRGTLRLRRVSQLLGVREGQLEMQCGGGDSLSLTARVVDEPGVETDHVVAGGGGGEAPGKIHRLARDAWARSA